MPAEGSTRINENYVLFQQLIGQHENELEAVCQGIAKLVIVDVSLDRSQDNPQLIFESMNSTGLELSQADLIRNFILMVVGSLAATAAATGTPVLSLAALAADQLLKAPKLRDIPKSIKDLADETTKLKRSPVGMLFKLSKGVG